MRQFITVVTLFKCKDKLRTNRLPGWSLATVVHSSLGCIMEQDSSLDVSVLRFYFKLVLKIKIDWLDQKSSISYQKKLKNNICQLTSWKSWGAVQLTQQENQQYSVKQQQIQLLKSNIYHRQAQKNTTHTHKRTQPLNTLTHLVIRNQAAMTATAAFTVCSDTTSSYWARLVLSEADAL